MSFAGGDPLIVYFFPGIEWFADAPVAAASDIARTDGFSYLYFDFLVRGYKVVGVSTQPLDELRDWAARERVLHAMASDSNLRLARELALPTGTVASKRVYKRVTLIVRDGLISTVFHPEQDAEYVLTSLAKLRSGAARRDDEQLMRAFGDPAPCGDSTDGWNPPSAQRDHGQAT